MSGELKISKAKNEKATDFEKAVAKSIMELESSASELTAELRPLQFNSAKEVSAHPLNI